MHFPSKKELIDPTSALSHGYHCGQFKDAVFVEQAKSSAVTNQKWPKNRKFHQQETKMQDAGPLLHSNTTKQSLHKGFYMHSSTDEQKANTRLSKQHPDILCPSTSPSLPSRSSLVMSLWSNNPPVQTFTYIKLQKSRLMTVRPPKAGCLYTHKSMYLCELKICAHSGLAGNFTLCL